MLNIVLKLILAISFTCAGSNIGLRQDDLKSKGLSDKVQRVFGEPLIRDKPVYALSDDYVIWILIDSQGTLLEADIGPKSYYTADFRDSRSDRSSNSLNQAQYQEILGQLSEIVPIGKIRVGHSHPLASPFGLLNTDQFENAFVDRIVDGQDETAVKRFDVHFVEEKSGSVEKLKSDQGQSMVCFVHVWYYLKDEKNLKLGEWRTVKAAGPSMRDTSDCIPTTVLYDAEGFRVEYPQNETIEFSEPYRVQIVTGRVTINDEGLEGAAVEIKQVGGNEILSSITDSSG
jgi:hypothetical protein